LGYISYVRYLALVHVKIAQQNKSDAEKHWREARTLHQKVLDEYLELQKQNTFPEGSFLPEGELRREVELCDKNLSKLEK